MNELEERYLSKDYFPFDKDQGAVRVRDETASIVELAAPEAEEDKR